MDSYRYSTVRFLRNKPFHGLCGCKVYNPMRRASGFLHMDEIRWYNTPLNLAEVFAVWNGDPTNVRSDEKQQSSTDFGNRISVVSDEEANQVVRQTMKPSDKHGTIAA